MNSELKRFSPPWIRRGQGVVGLLRFMHFIKLVKKNNPAGAFSPLNSHVIYGVGCKAKETIYSVPGALRWTPPHRWSPS